MATFKDRVKLLREEFQLTQKELGSKIDKSESTINMYESGKREPKTSEDYKRIANYFDVSLDYLLGRTDDRDTIVVKDKVNGQDIEMGVDRKEYPDGLTHEQVIEILQKFKAMGFKYKPEDKE